MTEACIMCKKLTAQGRLHQTLISKRSWMPCTWPLQSQVAKVMTLRQAQEPILYIAAILQAVSAAKRIFCCSPQPLVCIKARLPRAAHDLLHRS